MRTFTVAVLFLLCNGGGISSASTVISSGQSSNFINRPTVVRLLPMESGETKNAFLAPKEPFSHPSADVPMDLVSKRNLYTLAFFVETLSTGSDVHLIRSNVFDLPSDRERLVAIIVARLWSKLSIMGRINDILSATSAATAERYVNANDDDHSADRSNIFQFHYNITEESIKADPRLFKIYNKVREEVQRTSLPPLAAGTIDLRNVKTILRRAESEYLTNVRLRKVYLNLKFAYRAFGPVKTYYSNRTANVYVDDNSLLAQAIILLSAGSKVADEVQYIYDQAIEDVLRMEARNPQTFDVSHAAMENLLFLTLSRMLENDLKVNPKLAAAKRQLLSRI